MERLLADLAPLRDRIWLVIDDVHELDPDQALRQLELAIARFARPLNSRNGRPNRRASATPCSRCPGASWNRGVHTIAAPPAGTAGIGRPFARIAEHCRQAIELAQRHGWTDEPAAGTAYRTLGVVLAWQGRPEEAEPLIQHGERIVTPEIEPGAAIGVCFARAILELARGRDQDALAAARAVERLAARLAIPDLVVPRARALQLLALTRLGDTEHAEQALAGLEDQERERGDVRVATAALRLAQDDPQAAAATLAPGPAPRLDALARSSPQWGTDIGADQVKQSQTMTT